MQPKEPDPHPIPKLKQQIHKQNIESINLQLAQNIWLETKPEDHKSLQTGLKLEFSQEDPLLHIEKGNPAIRD